MKDVGGPNAAHQSMIAFAAPSADVEGVGYNQAYLLWSSRIMRMERSPVVDLPMLSQSN